VEGDARSAWIAAASIVAKVTRDALMTDYARLHPGYGFERHKGYATAAHLAALSRLGRCRYTVVRASPSGERAGWNNSFNFGAICGRKGRRLHKGTGSFDENRSTTTLAHRDFPVLNLLRRRVLIRCAFMERRFCQKTRA
jgi:Ribonuclease HII